MIAVHPGFALMGVLSACSAPAPPLADARAVPEPLLHEPFTVEVRCVEPDVAAHFSELQTMGGRPNARIHRDTEGRMDGYTLHPDAWWQRLGFQAGDRVRRVNGWALNERTMDAYRALHDEQTLAVELLRRGQLHMIVLRRDCTP
jgi:hypothetical protein